MTPYAWEGRRPVKKGEQNHAKKIPKRRGSPLVKLRLIIHGWESDSFRNEEEGTRREKMENLGDAEPYWKVWRENKSPWFYWRVLKRRLRVWSEKGKKKSLKQKSRKKCGKEERNFWTKSNASNSILLRRHRHWKSFSMVCEGERGPDMSKRGSQQRGRGSKKKVKERRNVRQPLKNKRSRPGFPGES